MTAVSERWAIVVPVKRLAIAKTRIELAPDTRMELALAMATDTIRAAADSDVVDVVIAVCDDPDALDVLRQAGAVVVPDEPGAGLNPALEHGATVGVVPVAAHLAAVAADLPALRSEELTDLLLVAATHPLTAVADAAGAGTTVFTAADRQRFRPAFGPDSRTRHVTAGAVDLTGVAGPTVRRDVDTLVDLADAARLGLGSATGEVVRARGLV